MLRWNENYGQWVVEKMIRHKRLFRRLPGEIGREQEEEARDIAARILSEFRLSALEDLGDPGYLYAVSNPALPGMLKIGMTTGTAELRVRNLSLMLPYPCKLEFAVTVRQTKRAESAVHQALTSQRVHPRREWFRVSVKEAIAAMSAVATNQAD